MRSSEAGRAGEARMRVKRPEAAESGVALLISLFALLLICVVGVALVMASGTHSALTGNYHSATSVYYGALAGLEEGRGRLLPKSPNYFNTLVAPPGSLLAPGQVRYVINPLPGETVAPWDTGTPTTYPDTEYQQEFGANPAPTPAIPAVIPPIGVPPFLYKWVRINPITPASEANIGVQVKNGFTSTTTPVLFANNQLTLDPPGAQALEITALAATPNGSQRMLQYVVAPVTFNLNFLAALTMVGTVGATFTGPASPPALTIDGTDAPGAGGCPGGAPVAGIGIAGNPPPTVAISGATVVPTPPPAGYTALTLGPNLQTVSGLQALVQLIEQNADVFPPAGPQTQTIFPPTMSPSNPVTIAVNGDLDLSTWTGQGYGVLLVTGTLTYNPASSWSGIILVIGQGTVVSTGSGGGSIFGAVLVAQIVANGGPPTLSTPSWTASGGNTIQYSSCWVNAVQSPTAYKILSFREIPQTTP
jgi:hypothetical protein